jgi:hypothetical protein
VFVGLVYIVSMGVCGICIHCIYGCLWDLCTLYLWVFVGLVYIVSMDVLGLVYIVSMGVCFGTCIHCIHGCLWVGLVYIVSMGVCGTCIYIYLMSAFCKVYGRYNDLIYNYKLSLSHMLSDIFHTNS